MVWLGLWPREEALLPPYPPGPEPGPEPGLCVGTTPPAPVLGQMTS